MSHVPINLGILVITLKRKFEDGAFKDTYHFSFANARNTSLGAPLVIPLLVREAARERSLPISPQFGSLEVANIEQAECSLASILPWTLAAILRR